MKTYTLYAEVLFLNDEGNPSCPEITVKQVDSRDLEKLKKIIRDLYPNGIYKFYAIKEEN